MAVGKSDGTINLVRLQKTVTRIHITSDTPYIAHAWSEKAKLMMPGHPDKPTTKQAKVAHQPQAEAEACTYRLPDGRPGIPAVALKAAMVGACRHFDGVSMAEAKLMFFVVGEGPEQLVPITGTQVLREDTPRVGMGTADLRYRHMFVDWAADVEIVHTEKISPESIVALLDAAGNGGVGDWRPSAPKSSTGTFGRFHVDTQS